MGRRDKVLVVYNEPVLPEGHPDYISEVEVIDNVVAVEAILGEAGYDVSRFAAPSTTTCSSPARAISTAPPPSTN